MPHLKLMIPGSIELEDDVLAWMGAPIQPHYGEEWVDIHNETLGLLQQVFITEGKVFMLPGAGDMGNDAAVQSMFAPGDHVAVGVNGICGKRLLETLETNGIVVIPVESVPDQPLDPEKFRRALIADRTIVGVAAVHLEASTAVLNPVHEIAQVAREFNCLSLVDAISSLGGTHLYMDAWGIDVCVSASHQGLGGPPGIAIVAVRPNAWAVIAGQPERPRSWYLDLRRWQWYAENWDDWHPFPVTMPTPTVLGLRAGLQSLVNDGVDARIARYEWLAQRLRDGLIALGLSLFVPEALMAPVLTAANCPTGVTSGQLIKYLAEEHQIKITAGLGSFKERVIRIGHMGRTLSEDDIDDLLNALYAFLSQYQAA